MEESHPLQKRHGTLLHAETANIFVAIALGLFVSYSVVATINARFGNKAARVVNILKSPICLVVVWTALCIGAIFAHFHTDMLQIARRYGQLAIGAATITVFLSLKPSPLPQTFHAPLVSLHKWTGRTSIAFALVHGAIYAIAFISRVAKSRSSTPSTSEGEHEKRHAGHEHHAFSTFNVFGMISLAFFVTILVVSLKPIRRRAYWLFYALHRPLVIVIYILMIWHARPSSTVLVALGLSFLAAQIVARTLMTCRVVVKDIIEYGPTLKLVHFECDNGPLDLSIEYGAASYIRVSKPILSPVEFFRPSHPYTLAGAGKLVIRESRFHFDRDLEYCAYGPFKASLNLSPYAKVLIIAGGSGISSAPSILTECTGSKNVSVVWITRDSAEVEILAPLGITDCNVYITGYGSSTAKDEEETYELDGYEYEADYVENDGNEQSGLLPDNAPAYQKGGIVKHRGRPNFDDAAKAIISTDPGSQLLVIACGPESLVNDVKHWAQQRNYSYWTEEYVL